MSQRAETRDAKRRALARSAAALLLGLACGVGPWLLGGHPPEAGAFLAVLTALALGAALFARPHDAQLTSSAKAILIVALAALAFTLLQRVPLPCGWLEGIARDAVAHRREVARLLGEPMPGACTITQSVGATELALVRGVSSVAAFFAALLLLGRRGSRRRMLTWVALSGAALAIVGLAHRAFGLRSLFGIYEPVHAHPSVMTPLLNGNNLAGLLLLTTPITFALAARAATAGARYALVGLASAQTLVIFLTGSRGGIAALLVLIVLGALALVRRGRSRSPRGEARSVARHVEIAVVSLLSVLVGAFLAFDGFMEELRAEQEDSKVVLLERGVALALTAPPLGLGRGAFGQAIAETFPYDRRVEFAENVVSQRVVDWGMPFAVFVLTTLSLAFARAALRRRSLLGLSASLGLVGLGLQNLVDFSLELPGVAVPAAITLAVVVSSAGSGAASTPLRPALKISVALLVFGVAIALGPVMPARTADAQLESLRALASAERAPEPPWPHIEGALALHPRDPAIALMSAHLVRRSRPDLAGPWLNRSLELSPHWASTHLEIARWLLERGRGAQAAIHLSRAAALDVHGARELTCTLIERGFAAEALRAAPEGAGRVLFLERAMSCVPRHDPRSPALETLALDVSPDVLEAKVRRAERDCVTSDVHLQVLRELIKSHRSSPRPHLALARCLVARKEHKEARAVERAALTHMPQLRQSFSRILRGGAPVREPDGSLDPKGQTGEGVFLPPATHSR